MSRNPNAKGKDDPTFVRYFTPRKEVEERFESPKGKNLPAGSKKALQLRATFALSRNLPELKYWPDMVKIMSENPQWASSASLIPATVFGPRHQGAFPNPGWNRNAGVFFNLPLRQNALLGHVYSKSQIRRGKHVGNGRGFFFREVRRLHGGQL